MRHVDAVVVGGGILGTFAARNLCRYNISTLLIEKQHDLCLGITRANTAIVYAGYDNKPGTLKARMCVRANGSFEALCRELDVPFKRCGSLMLSFGEKADRVLEKKLMQGRANGVPGLRLLTSSQALELEPMLSTDISSALYAPTTATVNPWQLGIAAMENARSNGAQLLLNTQLISVERLEGSYLLHTDREDILCRTVLNCAGLSAAQIQEMAFEPSVGTEYDSAEFLVLDSPAKSPKRIIFQETESGKGISAVPCTDGNLLLDSPPLPLGRPFATSAEGLVHIRRQAAGILPGLDMSAIIRSFAAVRPNPYRLSGESINDFCIENPAPGFYSLIGIKTPGLTCADELGRYLAEGCAAYLGAGKNPAFEPRRQGIHCEDDDIVCLCGKISRRAVVEAVRRGATTAEGVKRRAGTMMGRCQGSRCAYEIERIIEETRNGIL